MLSKMSQLFGVGIRDEGVDIMTQLESRLDDYRIFLDRLAEHVKDWEVETRHSMESLQRWGTTFGAVLGLETSPPESESYEAFILVLSTTQGLSTALEDNLQTIFYPLLQKLKAMTEHPKRLLREIHSFESFRTPSSPLVRFWRSDTSKNHQRFLYLRSTLLSELPILLGAMNRAIGLAFHTITQGFLKAVREIWIEFLDSLLVEGEHYGQEILRTWQMRSEDVQQALLDWDRKYVSAVGSKTSFRMVSPVNGKESKHEEWIFPDLVSFSYSDIPRVSSAPSLFPPNPIRQSIAGDAPVLYTIRAIQTYVPPAHDPYRGRPFFKLSKGDCFEVLEEYDHPAAHTDLPRRFMNKEGEDCLLKVRAKHDGVGYQVGAVGWALARFVSAD